MLGTIIGRAWQACGCKGTAHIGFGIAAQSGGFEAELVKVGSDWHARLILHICS